MLYVPPLRETNLLVSKMLGEEEEVLEQEGGDALRDALRHRGRHPRAAGLRRLLHGLEGAQGRAALRAEARVEPDARRPREGLSTPQARRAAAPRAPHPIPSPLTNHVERRIDRN